MDYEAILNIQKSQIVYSKVVLYKELEENYIIRTSHY